MMHFANEQDRRGFAIDYLHRSFSLGKLLADKEWEELHAVLTLVIDDRWLADVPDEMRLQLSKRIHELRCAGWTQIDIDRIASHDGRESH